MVGSIRIRMLALLCRAGCSSNSAVSILNLIFSIVYLPKNSNYLFIFHFFIFVLCSLCQQAG